MTDMTTRQTPSPRPAAEDRGSAPTGVPEFVTRLSRLASADVDRAGARVRTWVRW